MGIDLTPWVCETISSNTRASQIIKKEYEKDKEKYYTAARESDYWDHNAFQALELSREIVARQALGVISHPDGYRSMQKALSQGWPEIYRFIKKSKREINLEEVLLKVTKDGARIDYMTNDQLNGALLVSYILAQVEGLEIQHSPILEQLYFIYQNLEINASRQIRLSLFPDDVVKRATRYKDRVFETYQVNEQHNSFFSPKSKKGLTAMAESLTFMLDHEGLTSSIIEEVKMSEEEITEMFAGLINFYDAYDRIPTEDELKVFYPAAWTIRALSKRYNEAKEMYFSNAKDTLYPEVMRLMTELEKEKEESKQKQKALGNAHQEIDRLRNQLKTEYTRARSELDDEIKEQRRQISAYQEEKEKMLMELKELRTLQEALFAEPEDAPQIPEVINDQWDEICLIVGGHERWRNHITQYLPDRWRIIGPDDPFDPRILDSVLMVFFVTEYLSHAQYEAVSAAAKRKDIPIAYIPTTGVGSALNAIQRAL